MSLVPDPPAEAGKTEAHGLVPKTLPATGKSPVPPFQPMCAPDTLPGGPDRYAGLDLYKLRELQTQRQEEAERQRLIRELEGRLPPPRELHPSLTVSYRARRLRGLAPEIGDQGRDDGMRHQFTDLSAMFDDLLYNNAEGKGFDEKFGLMIALRAQRQAVLTAVALAKLQAIENLPNTPWRNKNDDRTV